VDGCRNVGRVDESCRVGEWGIHVVDLEEKLGDRIVHGGKAVWWWHFAADEGCAEVRVWWWLVEFGKGQWHGCGGELGYAGRWRGKRGNVGSAVPGGRLVVGRGKRCG
jgi:hypothetical protein